MEKFLISMVKYTKSILSVFDSLNSLMYLLILLLDCDCGKGFDCFTEVDKNKFPFGIGTTGEALAPYTSVAANDIREGTKVYVPQFDGVVLPSGERHNGCLKVQDKGFGFGGRHIDWFVARE